MTETCRRKSKTIKFIYTFISAFVGITYMNEFLNFFGAFKHFISFTLLLFFYAWENSHDTKLIMRLGELRDIMCLLLKSKLPPLIMNGGPTVTILKIRPQRTSQRNFAFL
jgi:hypothetical protein